ncbi:MAG TPA: NAD(P)H-dependent oxidoreductase [Caulobacteraceae bacterium]|jgi:FMN-dependent NADH-azoreductase|nr:NAD(P)H-dependent oxidoreductase [Caulobacteraceae bacterium]
MNILHIDSSVLADNSVTRALSARLTETLAAANPGASITYRDLAADPLDHLSGHVLAARFGAELARTPAQADDLARSEQALEDFLAADVIVLGAPMYNFSIPSQLKAWIDRIAVNGRTFRYTDTGVEGLAGGRKVIVVSSRGGIYSQGAMADFDFQEAYLKRLFGFLGVTDIEFVRAEGVNIGPEQKAQAVAAAHADIDGRDLRVAA